MACLIIAALIPVIFLVVHSETHVPLVTASGRTAIRAAAPGWRWEMWANVQLQVPDTWVRNQDILQACSIRAGDSPGFVSRPDAGAGFMEFCPNWMQAPTSAPNLTFLDGLPGAPPEPGTRIYPNGTLTVRQVGAARVMVTTRDDALRRQILASAEIVDGTDAAGCPVGIGFPALGRATSTGPSIADVHDVDLVSVCRYHPGSLSYAFTLSGAKAAALVSALQRAPAGSGPDDPKDCEEGEPENQAGLYRLWSGPTATDVWLHWDTCRGHGIDDGRNAYRLTADALTPFLGVAFGGGVSKSVPTRTASTPAGRWPVYVP
jgi:hypothetical protein